MLSLDQARDLRRSRIDKLIDRKLAVAMASPDTSIAAAMIDEAIAHAAAQGGATRVAPTASTLA